MYIFAAYNVYEYEVLSRSLTGTLFTGSGPHYNGGSLQLVFSNLLLVLLCRIVNVHLITIQIFFLL